jgi:hypothetical protein
MTTIMTGTGTGIAIAGGTIGGCMIEKPARIFVTIVAHAAIPTRTVWNFAQSGNVMSFRTRVGIAGRTE